MQFHGINFRDKSSQLILKGLSCPQNLIKNVLKLNKYANVKTLYIELVLEWRYNIKIALLFSFKSLMAF